MVKMELHQIDLILRLFNSNNELIIDKWREFKSSHCITSATMNVLLERHGDAFFADRKHVKTMNKIVELISPKVTKFFKVFFSKNNNLVMPIIVAHL